MTSVPVYSEAALSKEFGIPRKVFTGIRKNHDFQKKGRLIVYEKTAAEGLLEASGVDLEADPARTSSLMENALHAQAGAAEDTKNVRPAPEYKTLKIRKTDFPNPKIISAETGEGEIVRLRVRSSQFWIRGDLVEGRYIQKGLFELKPGTKHPTTKHRKGGRW